MDIRGSVDSRNFLAFGAILLAGVSLSVGILVGQTYGFQSPAFQEHIRMEDGDATLSYAPPHDEAATYLVTYNATRAGVSLDGARGKEYANVSRTNPIELRFPLDDRPLRVNVTVSSDHGATLQRSSVTLDRD